jgi:hypothetical protein
MIGRQRVLRVMREIQIATWTCDETRVHKRAVSMLFAICSYCRPRRE